MFRWRLLIKILNSPRLFDQNPFDSNNLFFDGKSIRKEKDTVKEKGRVNGKGKEGVF
jgi:hypothetical protein